MLPVVAASRQSLAAVRRGVAAAPPDHIWLPPLDDPLPEVEPEPLPVTLPEPLPDFTLPELELLPAEPTSNGCPCWAACRLWSFSRSMSPFCEVSAPLRDERIACAGERSISREAVFARLALVEFIPVVDVPVWSVPADECIVLFVAAWFVPFAGLFASFIPVVDVVASFVPVFALPVLFMPVILPLALVPAALPLLIPDDEPLPDEPCMVLLPLVAPVALFWLLVSAGAPCPGTAPVVD
jgi:hypothetical protein